VSAERAEEHSLLALNDGAFWVAWRSLSPQELAELPPEVAEAARKRFHRLRAERERARSRPAGAG